MEHARYAVFDDQLCGASLSFALSPPERTILVGTITPFDHGEVEDRSMLSLTSVLARILEDIQVHNADCTNPADEWPAPEHLWVSIFCFVLATL